MLGLKLYAGYRVRLAGNRYPLGGIYSPKSGLLSVGRNKLSKYSEIKKNLLSSQSVDFYGMTFFYGDFGIIQKTIQ